MSKNVEEIIFEELKSLRVENLVLQTVCGLLIAKTCMETDDPRDSMLKITSEMQGLADSTIRQRNPMDLSREFSDSTENICRLAEKTLLDLLHKA